MATLTLRDESTLARSQNSSSAGATKGVHLLVTGPHGFTTFALPARSVIVVGRGGSNDIGVKVDDPKASRRHLRLHVGEREEVEIEDLGSANGTRVGDRRLERGERVHVRIGEAISIGSLHLMVQPNRSVRGLARRQILSHPEFESRVEWECARAEATGIAFSVAHVETSANASNDGSPLRSIDVIGRGPGEIELLLPGIAGETARTLVFAFTRQLGRNGRIPPVGIASYPDDGRHAATLLARARDRTARGRQPDASAAGLAPIVSVEDNMLRVQAMAERAAAGNINVLILGETGVGKEVLASAVHASSARASRPMVCINCAALPESLVESELFGHERGAFTGAAQAKTGLLETASGGTVFLDEIGELPPAAQAKLLRVIETREILRVGGVRPRKIDVRFIAATNRDLEADSLQGRFRRDLFFRLGGMTLTIPPLRERPRDIPVFANAFVVQLAQMDPGPASPCFISEDAMAALRAYSWPGNVRELRYTIERAIVLTDGPALLPEHFPPRLLAPTASSPAPDAPAASLPTGDERARILAALAACGGNQSRAARQLGISRKVLMARLDRYGVARPKKSGAG